MTPLTTQRLILRPPTAGDMAAGTAFYMSEHARFVGGHVPRFRAWLNMAAILGHWQVRGYGLWAVTQKETGALIGFVGPFHPEGWPETEIGWVLFETAQGQGYAIEAAQAALTHARDVLGWRDIVHYIDPANARSISLAQRLGCALDPDAAVPKPEEPCLVYRQPRTA